ncbi:MAG: hypothetical protein ACRBCS_14790 [Cellvibrionaceae bacterium]
MKVQFPESAKNKLSQLSMAIEIHEKQRFAYRKNPKEITLMLKCASLSKNENVRNKFLELTKELPEQAILTLSSLGININKETFDKRRYRGQEVSPDTNVTEQVETSDNRLDDDSAQSKKKKIVYRGKVTYV